jgi:hypothetical protein
MRSQECYYLELLGHHRGFLAIFCTSTTSSGFIITTTTPATVPHAQDADEGKNDERKNGQTEVAQVDAE